MEKWCGEMTQRRQSYAQSRERSAVSAANARERSLRYAWRRMLNHSHLERMLLRSDATREGRSQSDGRWILDSYEDSLCRRWILRLDPFGAVASKERFHHRLSFPLSVF